MMDINFREIEEKVDSERETLMKKKEAEVVATRVSNETMKAAIKSEIGKERPMVIEVEQVELDPISVAKIKLPELRDTTGKISEEISKCETTTGIKVLQFKVTKILPCVVELSSHHIIKFDGESYTTGYLSTDRDEEVKEFALSLADQFTGYCEPITADLMTEAVALGYNFTTCMFNEYELKLLLGYLQEYNPKITRKTKNGHLSITIGNFYK